MTIFIHRNGEQSGPFSEAEISEKIAAGLLAREDSIWKEGMAAWALAGEALASLFPPLVVPPPFQAPAMPPLSPTAAAPQPEPPPAEKDAWWVVRDGKEFGPYTRELLRQYLASGNLVPDDQVRNDEGKDLRRLDTLLPASSIQFDKIAGKAAEIAQKSGEAASQLMDKALKNAGPLGDQVKSKVRGKEKLIGGAVIAALAVLGWIFLSSGEPSAGAMEKAQEKLVKQQTQALNSIGVEVSITNFKKIECKPADRGGYYCTAEADVSTKGPTGNNTRHVSETNRYIKGSDGWMVTN